MSSEHSTIPGLSKVRIEALTDGIFATVMTVLILSLSVPVIAGSLTSSQLSSVVIIDLEGLVPNILSYVLSFLILAVMWVSHHNVFHYIVKVDRPLLWLNIIFLLTIGFIPFSTALMGRYSLIQLPVIIYGINIIGIALSMQAVLLYSTRNKLLVAEGPDERVMKRIMARWRAGPVIYGSAVLLSFVSTYISIAIYVLALAYYVLSSSLGFRHKRAT